VYEYVRRSDGSYWHHLREHKELYWHQRVGVILLRVLPVILSGLRVEFVGHKAAWSQE
jgi:hypothetical protein